jgi:hypothetical protein
MPLGTDSTRQMVDVVLRFLRVFGWAETAGLIKHRRLKSIRSFVDVFILGLPFGINVKQCKLLLPTTGIVSG